MQLRSPRLTSTLLMTLLMPLFIALLISVSPPVYAKAEDFFRLNSGGLLISGIEMKYSEVMAMIKQDSSAEKIGRHRYILDASVGGQFDVQFKFSSGKLIEIEVKQLGRVHH